MMFFSAVAQSDQGIEWHVAAANDPSDVNGLEVLLGLDGGDNPVAFTVSQGLGNQIFRQDVLPALQPNVIYDNKFTFATTADPLVVDVSGTISLHGSATPFFSSGVHSVQLTKPLHYFIIIIGRDANSLTCLDALTIGYVPIPTTTITPPTTTSTPTAAATTTPAAAPVAVTATPTATVPVKKVKKHKKQETKKKNKKVVNKKENGKQKEKGEKQVKKDVKKNGKKKGNKKL